MTIDVEATPGGFILPDDRVDLVWSLIDAPEAKETTLRNVRLLSLDHRQVSGQAVVRMVATVEVTSDQAQALQGTLARGGGTLSLVLRGVAADDPKTAPERGANAINRSNPGSAAAPARTQLKSTRPLADNKGCSMLGILLGGDLNDPRSAGWIASCNKDPAACTAIKGGLDPGDSLTPGRKEILRRLTCPEPEARKPQEPRGTTQKLPEIDSRIAAFDDACAKLMLAALMEINDSRRRDWAERCSKHPNGGICEELNFTMRDTGKQLKLTCLGRKP